MKIAVCVCTYRRPEGLQNLLNHLGQIESDHELVIAVADNDTTECQGIQLVAARQNDYRWKLLSQSVEQRGISFSRNAATALALNEDPDLVAFLDDDEWPSRNWLAELLRVQTQTNADCVGGPTLPVFPDDATPAQRNNNYFGADLKLPDGSACQLEAAGNFLAKATTLKCLTPEVFNHDFALSGGEDLAFFMQLKQMGCRMHWAANAAVYESVPDERLSDQWMKHRVMVIANSRVHVMRAAQPGVPAAVIRGLKTVALFSVATLTSVTGLFSESQASKAALLRWKFWGKFTAHLSLRPERQEGR